MASDKRLMHNMYNKSFPKSFAKSVLPSLLVSMGRPKFTTKTSPSHSIQQSSSPSNTAISTNVTQHPKWYPDPISHFATVHFPDRRTDRQMV